MLLTLFAGGCSVLGVFAFHDGVLRLGWTGLEQVPHDPLLAALYFVGAVGLLEEACKLLACWVVCWPRRDFSEAWDGVCCASAVALGFATVENFKYVVETQQPTVLIGRFLLSTFAHVVMSGFWGYALGLCRARTGGSWMLVLEALLWSALLHGAYDWFLWSGYWPGALLVYAGMIVLFRQRLQESYFASRQRQSYSQQVKECAHCRGLSRADYTCCSQCGGSQQGQERFCLECLTACQPGDESCPSCARLFL